MREKVVLLPMPSLGISEVIAFLLFIAPIAGLVLIALNFPKIMYALGKAWARGVKDGSGQNKNP